MSNPQHEPTMEEILASIRKIISEDAPEGGAPAVEAAPAPVMTIVKDEVEAPRKLTLDEKIQKVEDLTLMIDRWRTLSDSRRKLQTFQIGADSLSSTILLKDGAGNEFRTSNSTVITSVIDEMKRTLDVKVKEVEEMISL